MKTERITTKLIDSTNDREKLKSIIDIIRNELTVISINISTTEKYFDEELKTINFKWRTLSYQKLQLQKLYDYACNKITIVNEEIKKENIKRSENEFQKKFYKLQRTCKQMCDEETYEQIMNEVYKYMDELENNNE